jgi:PPOX class probable F420-dependent enzyme
MVAPVGSLPEDMIAILRDRALGFVATVMPDGSPQLTEVWLDTDGEHIVINTVQTHQKARNVARDPRVAVNVVDPDQPTRYWGVRGVVVRATTEGGAEHIEELALRYTGRPYAWWGGRDQVRVILTVRVDSIAGRR